MAVFESSRALNDGARLNPINLFTSVAAAILAWNDRRVTRNSLGKLSTRQLNDIGLTRGDIHTF